MPRKKLPPVPKPETTAQESPSKKQREMPKMKVGQRDASVGEATLGREPGYVDSVGLGNLRVIHQGRGDYKY